jgi:hypothetical protein
VLFVLVSKYTVSYEKTSNQYGAKVVLQVTRRYGHCMLHPVHNAV